MKMLKNILEEHESPRGSYKDGVHLQWTVEVFHFLNDDIEDFLNTLY